LDAALLDAARCALTRAANAIPARFTPFYARVPTAERGDPRNRNPAEQSPAGVQLVSARQNLQCRRVTSS